MFIGFFNAKLYEMESFLCYSSQTINRNIMKGIKITVMMLLICQAVIAQNKTAEEVTEHRMERLDGQLDLTADQESKISKIVFASATEMLALKSTGTFDREQMRDLKKNERQLIKAELTPEQKEILKEQREGEKLERQKNRDLRMVKRTERQATKAALLAKRTAFEASLTTEEKAIIEQARALKPEKIKGKDAKAALTDEQKAERKAVNKEIGKMLKPIVVAHKAELEAIQTEFPPKAKLHKASNKGKGNHFKMKFLLMK